MSGETGIPGITRTENGFTVRITRKDPFTGKTIERSSKVSTPDLQEAIKTKEEMVVTLRKELEIGGETTRDIASMSYEAYVSFYQKQKASNGIARRNVIKLDWRVFNTFIIPHIRNVKLSSINKRVVLHFADQLREMMNENGVPYSVKTYIKAWALFKASIRYAVKIGILLEDPTHLISPKFPNAKPEKIKNFITREEAARLLDEAEREGTTEFCVISLSLILGLRVCEIKALTYGNIDLANGVLTVDKSFHAGFLNNKVKNSNNFILPLIGAAEYAVRKHHERNSNSKKNSDIFLPAIRSGKYFDTSWINSVLRRLCNRTGIPVITIHSCRVSANSILLSQTGSNPEIVSRILNHHTSSMRLHYTRVNLEESRKLIGSVWGVNNLK